MTQSIRYRAPEEVRAALENQGRRCTSQRLAIYDQLANALDHPTAEELHRASKAALPNISLATIYNALEALVDAGLAAKIPAAHGEGSARYDARPDSHYHLRCLKTGRVEDLPVSFDPDLVRKLDPELVERLDRQGFRLAGYRLELLGEFKTEVRLRTETETKTETEPTGPGDNDTARSDG